MQYRMVKLLSLLVLCNTLRRQEYPGDSACSLPPVSIATFLIKEIENQTKKLALALKVKGFMNVQYAIKKDEIYVIEVNFESE